MVYLSDRIARAEHNLVTVDLCSHQPVAMSPSYPFVLQPFFRYVSGFLAISSYIWLESFLLASHMPFLNTAIALYGHIHPQAPGPHR